MGCFNETCMLSNLPILAGDEIVTLLLMETEEGRGSCNPGVFFHPVPFMIYGKYNDYGGVENPTSPVSSYILNELKFSSLEKMLDFDTAIILPTKKNFVSALKDGTKTRPDVHPTYILKSVLDSFLEKFAWKDFRYEKPVTYQSLLDMIPPYIEMVKEYTKMEGVGHFWEPLPRLNSRDQNILGKIVREHGNNFTYKCFSQSFVDLVIELSDAEYKKELTKLLTEFSKFIMLDIFMMYGRRVYFPNRGYSQDTETTHQRMMSNIIIEEAEKIDRRWEDDDFPDDAWDPVRELFMEQESFDF